MLMSPLRHTGADTDEDGRLQPPHAARETMAGRPQPPVRREAPPARQARQEGCALAQEAVEVSARCVESRSLRPRNGMTFSSFVLLFAGSCSLSVSPRKDLQNTVATTEAGGTYGYKRTHPTSSTSSGPEHLLRFDGDLRLPPTRPTTKDDPRAQQRASPPLLSS